MLEAGIFSFRRMKHFAILLFPIAAMVGYFATDVFLLRSLTTLSCMVISLIIGLRRPALKAVGWVTAAFALSFAGDYVLGHWGGSFEGFVCGVGLFLLAHLGYVVYSLRCGRMQWWLLALLVVVFGAYFVLLLRPAIGDDVTRLAVLAYILVSCLSMAAAVGIGKSSEAYDRFARGLYIAGIFSLLFSDLLIAQKRFLHDGTLYTLMMPTYFLSQLLVTAALIRLRCWLKGGKKGQMLGH